MEVIDLESAHAQPAFVSVSITAYNSEKWLGRALESVLAQRTSFPFEIIIGDDGSQDATIQIAHGYRERYPDIVRVFERRANVGIQRNYYETFERCKGKYIAWLDADDYWTDANKLALQIEMLESDSSISACAHFVRWVKNDGEVKRNRYPELLPGRYRFEEILRRNFIATPSVVFRNGIQRGLPAWYFDLAPITDWPIWVLAAIFGDIVLLDRVMADYTLTDGSSMTSKGNLFWYSMDVKFYEHIESILPAKWHRLVRSEKGKRYEEIAYSLRKQGDFAGSRKAAIQAFWAPCLTDNPGSKTKALMAALVREWQWRLRGLPSKK